ncbi:hypothetical protein CVT26_011137 [Gymnopilus dilepis]|uniref:Uncharacterized protein n=1 Tax=Gymnopilus dilepis TaxID=231916 RepID=A0A409VYW5_9AGAR|nr:hypothetical protein CVT26_011137 [Gymnopilus dilepis]
MKVGVRVKSDVDVDVDVVEEGGGTSGGEENVNYDLEKGRWKRSALGYVSTWEHKEKESTLTGTYEEYSAMQASNALHSRHLTPSPRRLRLQPRNPKGEETMPNMWQPPLAGVLDRGFLCLLHHLFVTEYRYGDDVSPASAPYDSSIVDNYTRAKSDI